jgi:uroporphyrinogen decarboxylase
MIALKNDRFLRALMRQPVDCTPVWMMRQAGRYLPEYRAVRAEAGDFLTLCKNVEFACEVTLQPLRRFDLDAAILFSDILTIPDAMGLGLYFVTGEGPKFRHPVRTEVDVARLKPPQVETDLNYVLRAVSTIRQALNGSVPLIGFSGSPWTLACYMVEGGSSKDFRHVKAMMYRSPELMHQVLGVLADAVTDYLNAQIDHGAQAVQIFDTWGGVLSGPCYQTFSLAYMDRIIQGLKRQSEGRPIPIILFTKNGGQWLPAMAATGADALSLDWTTEMSTARQQVGSQVALQGNMDPALLYADGAVIQQEVGRILADFGAHNGHVFNLGHGIHQFVEPDHAKIFVDAVHELSVPYHQ